MTSTDRLGDTLVLVDHDKRVDIIGAAQTATLTMTIDGASTVEVPCADPQRKLLRSPEVDTRSKVVVDGITFELCKLSKSGSTYTLTFEDEVVAKLRRQTKHLVVKGGHVTRAQFAKRLAHEAHVDIAVDPSHKQKVRTVLERSAHGTGKTNSWDILGSDIAEPIHWRRFSDGRRLVIGGDGWLAGRYQTIALSEHTGAVNDIDFDLDEGKRASTATLVVDADLWSVPPGRPVSLSGMGPADGRWLVREFTRPLTSTRGTVTLTRARHVLKEPKKKGGR